MQLAHVYSLKHRITISNNKFNNYERVIVNLISEWINSDNWIEWFLRKNDFMRISSVVYIDLMSYWIKKNDNIQFPMPYIPLQWELYQAW